MKKSTRNNLIILGAILGGGYLIYNYLTGGTKKPPESNYPSYNFMEGVANKVYVEVGKLPYKYWERSKVFEFNENINTNVTGAKQTQDFLNLTGIITRVNPFTRMVAPFVDVALKGTSDYINKYLGG